MKKKEVAVVGDEAKKLGSGRHNRLSLDIVVMPSENNGSAPRVKKGQDDNHVRTSKYIVECRLKHQDCNAMERR